MQWAPSIGWSNTNWCCSSTVLTVDPAETTVTRVFFFLFFQQLLWKTPDKRLQFSNFSASAVWLYKTTWRVTRSFPSSSVWCCLANFKWPELNLPIWYQGKLIMLSKFLHSAVTLKSRSHWCCGILWVCIKSSLFLFPLKIKFHVYWCFKNGNMFLLLIFFFIFLTN